MGPNREHKAMRRYKMVFFDVLPLYRVKRYLVRSGPSLPFMISCYSPMYNNIPSGSIAHKPKFFQNIKGSF